MVARPPHPSAATAEHADAASAADGGTADDAAAAIDDAAAAVDDDDDDDNDEIWELTVSHRGASLPVPVRASATARDVFAFVESAFAFERALVKVRRQQNKTNQNKQTTVQIDFFEQHDEHLYFRITFALERALVKAVRQYSCHSNQYKFEMSRSPHKQPILSTRRRK